MIKKSLYALLRPAVSLLMGRPWKRQQRPVKNWHDLCDKWGREGYDELEESEQVWLNVRALIDATSNGGLISYFYNSGADTFDDAIDALNEIEAFEVAEIVESFGRFFGDEVPYSVNERNQIIRAWPQGGKESQACENVDDVLLPQVADLETRLELYLIDHGYDPDYGF